MVYSKTAADSRKLQFLYTHSGIETRYSVIPDFKAEPGQYKFFSPASDLEPFTSVEKRMQWFNDEALNLAAKAIRECTAGKIALTEITHLITVSCTGLSAPGMDLQLIESLNLRNNIIRTSVNFMGCYAAIHALKIADSFCRSVSDANVVIVCTELCTLHFQKENSIDNITSSLLFSDGCAAALVSSGNTDGIRINSFYSEMFPEGKSHMAWEIGQTGFQMTLSQEIPLFIKKFFPDVVKAAMLKGNCNLSSPSHWCIHPGGRKILDTIKESLHLHSEALSSSYRILKDYGNMSSATILFVLKDLLDNHVKMPLIFGAAFGPGLTIETFTASYD
jgi:predicted naringenin-chalcone synthase